MPGQGQWRDAVFHGVRIVLVVLAVTATAWPIDRLRRAVAVLDRVGHVRWWLALVIVSFAAVLLMLLARRRPQSRAVRAAESLVAVLLIIVPSGLLGFPPVPRWVAMGLLGPSVQPLATAWLAIVLTRPANPRLTAPKSEQPTDIIADR